MTGDRRQLIGACAVTIIAEHGPRALTHRAVDAALGIPQGSTSYYFRTREALLTAAVQHIVERSQSTFDELLETNSDPATLIARYLGDLLSRRRNELIARYALLPETRSNRELHDALAQSLFSTAKAQEIFVRHGVKNPESAAADLVSLLEGLIFDRCIGARSTHTHHTESSESILQLRIPIDAYLRGAR
ncbi:TetR family transcriptional regulator [Rhodococcus sp. IEGM 1366]|uniref:TetR/AcrR family transcriptional regulator n=1 Tax=Rhodococcus sp. IEGM 1366 TaxID=3082223 RepID=UPI002953AC29|nr:TetR family transcriptional regulator [Rhodococcus sp. IEGM 1366]MDV8067225.1 TetR family transcriptional regulator [Rhodococcus sp. IEGM 1366]